MTKNPPPPTGAGDTEDTSRRTSQHRTYRLEKTNAVTSGKWYFELEVLTSGPMRVGWLEVGSPPGAELGSDDKSWAFDGFHVSRGFDAGVSRGRRCPWWSGSGRMLGGREGVDSWWSLGECFWV